ncbi:hypothetical protein JOQ06_004655, partial [Pogonophryne albipinna]
MAEESAVKVCVRVRPLIPGEDCAASENAEPVHYFWKADAKSIYQSDDGNSSKSFSFDRVFTAEETTNQLYQAIAKPFVVSSVQGYNGTIFAYGQTSSGKTFTMMGSDRFPGVLPMAVEDVFQTIKSCPKKEFLLRVSYMEIYNETVSDLLVDSWKRKPLEVRETINKTIYVADLTEELVTSHAQVLAWIRKGEQNRHYGKTKMNERSSRSHTIFRMILENRERSDPASGENADGAIIVSHLNLVDLAGSERASQTGAEGTRFKEGCNINRSLFTLGQVIKRLTDEGQKGFTNYRDSKLTRILQNSLGGNAKTVIICTITPVTLEETLSTLQFASTAKKMKNDPRVTEVSDEGALLKRYRNEIEDLKRQLQEVSSVTQTTAKEKKSLSQRLQVKDQLQTEQEDRIRNLTKLLVTSSNLVPVQKVPKRRETWGGKMQGLAPGKDFDAPWGIPDEPSDEMDMNQTSVTVPSFADGPKDFVSPARMHELSGRVSFLMMQLEMELILSANHEKMEAEVRSLRCELDTEKTRFSKMQNDLQKELNVVFDENTKLTSLLDGKVPQNLIDSMELERRVAQLSRELTVSQEAEGALKAELASFQTLPEKLDSLMKQLDELSEELQSVRAEKETLLSEQSAAAQSSAEEMEKLLSAVTSLTAERDQLQGDLQENVDMMIENQEELRTALEKNRQQRETIKRLENAQTSQQEAPPNETSAQTEELQTLMIENQEELRVSQEKVGVLQDEISALKSQKAELESRASDAEITLQLQELHNQALNEQLQEAQVKAGHRVSSHKQATQLLQTESSLDQQKKTLTEKLESIEEERDALLSEKETSGQRSTEEMEKLQSRVTSLSEDRHQLQETLEGLRQEKQQLRDQLEDRMVM